MDRKDVAKRFVGRVLKEFSPHVKKVILFGSVAEDRDGNDSDIDAAMGLLDQGFYIDDIDDMLSARLPEEHIEEPISEKILEFFGF